MIYTRIEWIWTDEGLKETFVESCEYEGEFVMCGGGDNGGGGNGDSNGGSNDGGPSGTSMSQQQKEKEEEERKAKEASDRAYQAASYATLHGTLEGSGFEGDSFLMSSTSSLRTNDPDYLGDDSSSSGSATTTTATAETTGDDEPEVTEDEPLSTFVDDEALRKTRRRLRDRFGRRATRGGGAETVGTGYSLGS
tara:strand:- start:38 stop:619 length:582 start_codon:yes stop_codon:yes gene_type:complete